MNIPTAHKLALLKSAFGRSPHATDARPEALFHSVRAALAFAYTIGEFPIASSPKLGPTTGGSGRLSGLSPQEKHGQGALIRRAVEQRLRGITMAMVFADHGFGAIRSAAIREVSWEVAKLARNKNLGMDIAVRLFSRNGICATQADLARKYGCGRSTVAELEKVINTEMLRIRTEAEGALVGMFVSTGIAEGV